MSLDDFQRYWREIQALLVAARAETLGIRRSLRAAGRGQLVDKITGGESVERCVEIANRVGARAGWPSVLLIQARYEPGDERRRGECERNGAGTIARLMVPLNGFGVQTPVNTGDADWGTPWLVGALTKSFLVTSSFSDPTGRGGRTQN